MGMTKTTIGSRPACTQRVQLGRDATRVGIPQSGRFRFGHGVVCRAESTHPSIRYVNEEELEVAIQSREKPMVIDFYATWCGPCVMLSKELEQVAEQLGDKVDILKIDCDQNEGISNALQIQGLPTLIFVSTSNEKPALRTEGLLPAQSIIEIVTNEL